MLSQWPLNTPPYSAKPGADKVTDPTRRILRQGTIMEKMKIGRPQTDNIEPVRTTVSEKLKKRIDRRAEAEYGGNVSKMVRDILNENV